MGANSLKKDRETIMLENRESRLMLWDLLRLRYPEWELTERPIAVDEILPELRHVFNIFHPSSRKCYLQNVAAYEVMAPTGNSS